MRRGGSAEKKVLELVCFCVKLVLLSCLFLVCVCFSICGRKEIINCFEFLFDLIPHLPLFL